MDSGSFYKNAKSRPFQTVFIFTQNNKKTLDSQGFHQQAPGRTRTGDLRITNALLYQLSYFGNIYFLNAGANIICLFDI